MGECKKIIIAKDDLKFIQDNYAGIYQLMKRHLSNYDEKNEILELTSSQYQELWNRFTFEIGKATNSLGKINEAGLRLQKIWDKG